MQTVANRHVRKLAWGHAKIHVLKHAKAHVALPVPLLVKMTATTPVWAAAPTLAQVVVPIHAREAVLMRVQQVAQTIVIALVRVRP